jgi:hypothetical protein
MQTSPLTYTGVVSPSTVSGPPLWKKMQFSPFSLVDVVTSPVTDPAALTPRPAGQPAM